MDMLQMLTTIACNAGCGSPVTRFRSHRTPQAHFTLIFVKHAAMPPSAALESTCKLGCVKWHVHCFQFPTQPLNALCSHC
jgi:hypothetical protein